MDADAVRKENMREDVDASCNRVTSKALVIASLLKPMPDHDINGEINGQITEPSTGLPRFLENEADAKCDQINVASIA